MVLSKWDMRTFVWAKLGPVVMIFRIKKRINTELFIAWSAALYMVQSQIKDKASEKILYIYRAGANKKHCLLLKSMGMKGWMSAKS